MPRNRLLLEDSTDLLLENFSLNYTYNTLLDGIVDYLKSMIDPAADLNYIGKLPSINSREDYEHFPTGIFPFIGVALPADDFQAFETMGTNYPATSIQIIYAFKTSGATPEDDMTQFWDLIQDLKMLLFGTMRDTRFDMPDNILSMKVLNMFAFPSFYTEVDKNRKCFNIGFFPLLLEVSGI